MQSGRYAGDIGQSETRFTALKEAVVTDSLGQCVPVRRCNIALCLIR
jgi:hypothetical protein